MSAWRWSGLTTLPRGGAWQEAFELFADADESGLLGLGGPAGVRRRRLRRRPPRHDGRGVGAGLRRAARGRGDRRRAGAAVRVAMHLLFDTALMAPVRGWLARAEQLLDDGGETPVHAWLAVVRNYERMLIGDLEQRAGVGPAWPSRSVRRCDPAAAAIGRVAEASDPHPRWRRHRGSRAARRGGGGCDLGRPRPPLDRSRLLRARVRAPGPRAVRPGGGVDRGDGAVVEDERHRQPSRTLPGSPRGDPQVARAVPRRRGCRRSSPSRSFGPTCDASWDGR